MLRKLCRLLGLAALLTLVCAAACAQTWAVSPEGMTLGEALSRCADGDEIVLAGGRYDQERETFPLVVDKAVTLAAAQGEEALIYAPHHLSGLKIEADGVTLRGVTVALEHIGLYVTGDDLTVEDCRFLLGDPAWRTSSCAIWLGGVYRAKLLNCDFTGCGPCLAGPPISDRAIELGLPVLTGMFEVGEDLGFFTSHTIENCRVNGKPLYYITGQETVDAPKDAGMLLCAACGSVTAEGLDVSGSSMGMELAYNGRVTVRGCRADRCGIFGVYACKGTDVLMQDCTVEETNHGLDVRACSRVSLIGCTALNCDQGLFFSKVDDGSMVDCTVQNTGQGIFTAGGHRNLFSGCRVSGCENGMNIQKDSEARIIGCEITGCTVCGVRLDRSPTVFVGNTLRDNWTGVMAYGGVPFVIADNRFDANRSCGLFLRDIACSRLTGNVFVNHAKSSVDARGDMGLSLWYGNTLDLPMLQEKTAVFTMPQ